VITIKIININCKEKLKKNNDKLKNKNKIASTIEINHYLIEHTFSSFLDFFFRILKSFIIIIKFINFLFF